MNLRLGRATRKKIILTLNLVWVLQRPRIKQTALGITQRFIKYSDAFGLNLIYSFGSHVSLITSFAYFINVAVIFDLLYTLYLVLKDIAGGKLEHVLGSYLRTGRRLELFQYIYLYIYIYCFIFLVRKKSTVVVK